MTSVDDLDGRIRATIRELVDAAPPAPELPWLDAGHPSTRYRLRRRLSGGSVRRPLGPPTWAPVAGVAAVVAVAAVLVVTLIGGSSSPGPLTETMLGLQVTGYTAPAVQPSPPAGYQVVATGTAFGHPWVVAGLPSSSGQIGTWLAYDGRMLISGGAPTTAAVSVPPRFRGRAHIDMGLGVAGDDQRFLVGATNGPVATVTVRSRHGTTVTGSLLPHRLGTTRFFLLSLGRQGDCHQLCQGAVTVTVADGHGRVLAVQTL